MLTRTNYKTTADIVSDEELTRVHANAKFGNMTPRQVVDEGVLKYAYGYSSGHTQMTILIEHGLIRTPKPGRYNSTLTKKGIKYLQLAWPYRDTVASMGGPDWEAFGREVMEVWPEGDLDGFSLQEAAVKHRIIQPVEGGYNPEVHSNNIADAEPGDPWFVHNFGPK